MKGKWTSFVTTERQIKKMHNVRIHLNLYKGIELKYDYNTFNIRNLYISIGSRISFCTILIDRYVSHICKTI